MKLTRHTKHLIIRPLTAADYEAWRTSHQSARPPKNKWDRKAKTNEELTRTKFRKILSYQKKSRAADEYYDLAVFEKSTKKLVGAVAAMDVSRSVAQSAYLGYSIGNLFWGKGYGKEATLAMIDIGFKDLKLHRLEAGIEPTNRRSILLARSIGLRKEGLKKRAVFLRGAWQDLVMYSATCEDFGIKWRGSAKKRST